jgi:heme/copper-type cytochrome/quinol oxidase subunit 1
VAVNAAVHPVTWKSGRVARWLVTVDHKRIGIMYIATSIGFFVLGGILALHKLSELASLQVT